MSQATSNDTEGESPSAHFKTLRTLVPYLWPRGRGGLKLRVVIAMAFLAAAKLTTVYVPFLYKAAVDALTVESTAIIVVPLFVIIGYGLARVMAGRHGPCGSDGRWKQRALRFGSRRQRHQDLGRTHPGRHSARDD